MSGQPAARQGDRVAKGKIINGSLTVRIGSQGGIACSECPGGITVGSPVNPQLGAKVLLGAEDLDFALPAALPVVWQRQYSSYVNPTHGAACGLLGHGWHMLQELRLELQDDATLLFDASGRVITFDEPLPPGGQLHSASEGIWLLRGGGTGTGIAPWASHARWCHIEPALACSANAIFVASGNGDTLWHLGTLPTEQAHALAGDPWRLQAQTDRLGRSQRYHYSDGSQRGISQRMEQGARRGDTTTDSEPLPPGRLIALTDGAGRHYRLLHQRIHGGKEAQGLQALWGADDGWRVAAVELTHDPIAPLRGPITLVRYGYSAEGDLATVHNRAGQLVREFEWEHHRISAHRHAHGPWHRYRYESNAPGARVIEHSNQEGLDYRFEYQQLPASPQGQPRASTRVSDSLGRVEIYHFEGAPGLSRLIAHDKADGSRWRQAHDGFGRLTCSTDPLGRSTYLRRDGQGRIIGTQLPDGRSTQQHYDDTTGRLLQSTDAAGACTTYQYDRWGRLTQTTQAYGSYERYHYPSPAEAPLNSDSPQRIEDAHGASRHLTWSDAGQLLSYTDCSGHRTRYHYDRFGALTETTDAQGQRLRHQRDAQGRIVATELPGGQIERYHYDEAGQLTRIEPAQKAQGVHAMQSMPPAQVAQPPDHSIHLRYDLWGRLVQRTQGGLSLGFEYDAAGRLTRLVNENGAQSRFAWDVLDRLVQEEGFDQRLQRYRWDAAGQLVQACDGNARNHSSSFYTWDEGGRLTQRQLPASEHAPAQTHRYEWDAAGHLTAASVWLHPGPIGDDALANPEQLQSRIELQRDLLGRITGEVQQLYRCDTSETGHTSHQGGTEGTAAHTPALEYEHRITHTLDALGNRQHSQLQGLGTIAWLLYGPGHVHGLQHNGRNLIDFERDTLHRETRRSLHPLGHAAGQEPVHIHRQWDSLGRLAALGTRGLQLPPSPQSPELPSNAQTSALPLIGQIVGRRYHYDALGQLGAIEQISTPGQPTQLLRYGYDAAGRLRTATDSLQPQAIEQWRIDPAGNRLPGKSASADSTQDHWAAQAHAQWRQASFNLLGLDHLARQQHGPVQRWADNRIGYSECCAWRYDDYGRRTEQLQSTNSAGQTAPGQAHRSRQQLRYDGNHQLIEVSTTRSDGTPEQTTHYTYDALGRRLRKKSGTAPPHQSGTHICSQTSYYGWDGERLIHTERLQSGADGKNTRHIEHTVYENDSFTPLVRLSTTAQGSPQQQPHLLVRAMQTGLPASSGGGDDSNSSEHGTDDTNAHALAMMQAMLCALPPHMQQQAEQNMRQALQNSTPGEQPPEAARMLSGMREKLDQQQQQEHAHIDIHYYHCDHLGTPLALTDHAGQVTWAAKLDPWGNVLQEYNPHDIAQPIRLPGQHHDRETNLYYNRHRYYDPQIGSYITQDPIGLEGGFNKFSYPLNPMEWTDPLGLQKAGRGRSGHYGQKPKKPRKPDYQSTAKISKGWEESGEKVKESVDALAELANKVSGKDSAEKSVTEATVCVLQRNTETNEDSTPTRILTTDSRGNGVIRDPSSEELPPGFICIDSRFRNIISGPPPGL